MNHLTERERMIATMVAQGALNRDIAEALHLSETTIKNDISTIFRVLHLGAGRDQRVMLANLVAEDRARERDGGEEGGYG